MAAILDQPPEIARLIELSEASRCELGREVAAFRQRLDGPAKALRSVRAHPLRWVGGAMATGLAATLIFRRRSGLPRKSKGPGRWLFSLAFAAAKPAVKSWLTHQFRQLLATQLTRSSQPPSNPLPEYPGATRRR